MYFIWWLCSNPPRGNFVKNTFQNVSKSNKNLKQKVIIMRYYKKQIIAEWHLTILLRLWLKTSRRIIKHWSSIALFGTTNRVPRPSRSIKLHLKLSQKRVNNNNCNNKPFCKTWSCLRRPFTKWSKKYKNDIIKIQNDIIACLVKFIRKKIKEDILEYYTPVSDKGIHQFSCKKNLLYTYVL